MPVRIGGTPLTPIIGGRPTFPTRPGTPPTVPGPVAPAPLPGWRPKPGGWMKPEYDITIPDNLGRAPRTSDVTIKKGFDGRSPDQVVDKVKSNLTTALAPQNRALVDRHIKENHRTFTMAVSNMFVAGSPPNRFVSSLAEHHSITVQMTLSGFNPVILVAQPVGPKPARYFAKGTNGDWVQIPKPKYDVVAESKLRFSPEPSLTVSYPKWSVPALAGPLGEITEL